MNSINGFFGEYRFLSNFYPVIVQYDNIYYRSVEHAYQAAKTLDQYNRNYISNLVEAREVKKFSKKLVIRPEWEKIKLSIMEDLIRQKFSHFNLKTKLLLTGNTYLEETNTWNDTFWGVCKGVGENHPGKILMKVRKSLQNS